MIPRISRIEPMADFKIRVTFDEGRTVVYDVGVDIKEIKAFEDLKTLPYLFNYIPHALKKIRNRYRIFSRTRLLIQVAHALSGMKELICRVIRFMSTGSRFDSALY